MALPAWMERVDRRAQRTFAERWTAPAFLALSAALAVSALVDETGRPARLVMSGGWLVMGLTALVARRRRQRRQATRG
jgi:MYXO-CTERM domain-containing protein